MNNTLMLKAIGLGMLISLLFPSPVEALQITSVPIASGLNRPVFVTAPPEDTERLFIIEQHEGIIKILDRRTEEINIFLDIGEQVATGSEQGLLGLAFHPDYANNGLFYLNFTDTSGSTNIRRYQVSDSDPNLADATSATTILSYSQPQSNHNGGWLGFGPDGFLYVASGDGGGRDDKDSGHTPGLGNAQDITDNLLGKILRVDVDGDDFPEDDQRNYAIPSSNPFVGIVGDDEIWAYGLRNPWRPSFDRETGDFYLGDVGQDTREEINFQPASSSGGENYGWRLREGTIPTPTGGVGGLKPSGAIDPIYDYAHGVGTTEGFSVTGGYVYRGPIAELQGKYFFADFATERIWSLEFDGSSVDEFDGTNFTNFTDWTEVLKPEEGNINSIASFGEDPLGNLYIVDLGGEVFQIQDTSLNVPEPSLSLGLLVLGILGVVGRQF